MYRIRLHDGTLTDMVNRTHAKHAASAIALRAANESTKSKTRGTLLPLEPAGGVKTSSAA
jgi:hypothetical protein